MTFSASIKAIMERISGRPIPAEPSQTAAPNLSPDDIINAVIAYIDETVMPRTLVVCIAGADVLRLQVANQRLLAIRPTADAKLFSATYAALEQNEAQEKAVSFLRVLADHTADGGALEIFPDIDAPDFEAEPQAGVDVETLRKALETPKAKADPKPKAKDNSKQSASPSATKEKQSAAATKKASKPAKKHARAAKAQPSDALKSAYATFAEFSDTVILLSSAGKQIDISNTSEPSPLTGIQKALADQVMAWRAATTDAIGDGTFVVLRSEGLDGHCLCILPDDGFFMVAFVQNRYLSRLFGTAFHKDSDGVTS